MAASPQRKRISCALHCQLQIGLVVQITLGTSEVLAIRVNKTTTHFCKTFHLHPCIFKGKFEEINAMVILLKKNANEQDIAAIREKLKSLPHQKKGVDTKKYCGVIKLKEDPLLIQKKMRDEWQ
jgi:hypothetical protein